MRGASSRRIAIIDDDDAVRDSLDALLRSHGFAVETFDSALEFLSDCDEQDHGYDCVIADLHMPRVNGLELFELLRSRRMKLPFVMMTGRSDSALRERARRAGMVALLDKPIDENSLTAAIDRAVASQDTRRNLMNLKLIRLELARGKDHPAGDSGYGYTFRAPLDTQGRIDPSAWKEVSNLCVVTHFEAGHDVKQGDLLRTRAGRWVFSYEPGEDDDEVLFRLSTHVFAPGEYVSITEHNGLEQTYRVASVEDWHPQPALST